MTRPALVAIAATFAALCLCCLFWHSRSKPSAAGPSSQVAALGPCSAADTLSADDLAPTLVYAHNLLLRKGPNFRVYIRWIRGQMVRTRRQVNPSFDDPESFVLQIQKGVIHANIGDISNYLNASSPPNAPLKNISMQPEGDQLKVHGTIHKIISLPAEAFAVVRKALQKTGKVAIGKIAFSGREHVLAVVAAGDEDRGNDGVHAEPVRIDGEVGYHFGNTNLAQSWIRGFLIGHEFTDRLEAYVEIYDQQDANRIYSPSEDGSSQVRQPKQRQAIIGAGGRYGLNKQKNVILLMMAGKSFQDAQPSKQLTKLDCIFWDSVPTWARLKRPKRQIGESAPRQ